MTKSISRQLGIAFSTPESTIFKQLDPSYNMFFISSGECVVNITDDKRRLKTNHRLIVEGDHFGEIGLIYHCNRTASV